MKALHLLSAGEIASLTRTGDVTVEAVVRSCLERVTEREGQVQAWQFLDPDAALRQARRLDGLGRRGPLHGVPIAVKDLIDTCDMPTEYGSSIYAGHRPAADAACVALSRKAGAVVMGKTVTTEFAMRRPGKTTLPLDPARTPGGSSSGSAAAVADFMVPLALGTQTGGSTIRPASFCGCVGYRPTWGDLSCVGVKEAARSFDTLGLLARTVEDIALYRNVLLGIDRGPPQASRTPPRIGFCRTHLWDRCEPATQRLLEDCAALLARAGAQVQEPAWPAEFGQIATAHSIVCSFEYIRNFSYEVENHWEQISPILRQTRLKEGLACSFDDYRQARHLLERYRRTLDSLFEKYDVLLAPSAAGEAPVGLDSTGDASFAQLWTVMLTPTMSLPLFRGDHGLPIGAQLVAPRDGDEKLLEVALWVQAACR